MTKITDIKEKISIPDNVDTSLEKEIITIKGSKGSLSRIFSHPKININICDKIVEIQ